MILFFSSDGNALFQKNVLSSLSLPSGYCIHVRYWEEIVSQSVLDKFHRLRNLEGVHIYVKGNDPSIQKEDRQVEYFSVRKVQIVDYRKDPQTGLIHFYLELGDFINPVIKYPSQGSLPPYKFVTEGEISLLNPVQWYEKIERLVAFDESFKDSLFYNFNLKKYIGRWPDSVECRYDFQEETSCFRLSEGKSYIIELAILISDLRQDQLENYECLFEYDKNDILITNPSTVIIGTKKDSRRYRLITKSISNIHSFDYLKLISRKREGENYSEFYETIIRFDITKNKRKAIFFVVLFFLNVIGTAWLAFLLSEKKFNLSNMLAALILVVTSALGQYYYYNKS